ncbi:hypothetical protein [Pseudoclavibacter sp. CFCC 14310]|uniref:hypothetical protein n=1 Tax=Pseudoclavibacter sp. CFCC 14310 TaxID=2615180 RepID=UPI0017883667|nr:hypothetical protein [Pseudoclavibacter sp. CFCC 14310]
MIDSFVEGIEDAGVPIVTDAHVERQPSKTMTGRPAAPNRNDRARPVTSMSESTQL